MNKSVLRLLGCIRGVAFGSAIVGLALGLNGLQVASLLFYKAFPRSTILFNSKMAGLIWYLLQYYFEKIQLGHVTFSGDAIPPNENALVISNHVSSIDFLLLNALAMRKGMLSNCKYCLKDSLKYMPAFGWGMWLIGMVFLKRNWSKDEMHMKKAFSKLKQEAIPVWLTLYVEGTRFSKVKKEKSIAYAQKNNLPILENVLLPRIKGFICAVNNLRNSHVKYLYDLSFVYIHRQKGLGFCPSLLEVFTCSQGLSVNYDFHLHAERFKIEELPESPSDLGQWVLTQWVKKNKLLGLIKDGRSLQSLAGYRNVP